MADISAKTPPPVGASKPADLVEHFFRHEAARLHGTLIRVMGVNNMTLAEDVAQEALLRAMRAWSMGGIPPNPAAWISRVAINLARDAMRHERMSVGKEPEIITHFEQTRATPAVAWESVQEIRDDTLRLMFVCCHPSVSSDSQVILALKVLCGFTTSEIARAFLSSDAAIEKQLTRTKQRIADAGIGFEIPQEQDLAGRLDGVMSALYLLFNEGYKASSGEKLLREDLCKEAIRLATLLVAHPAGDTPQGHALLALMLLSSARFPSRVGEQGELLRLESQDRSKWDQEMIVRGLGELARAAQGAALSEYHLQAGIAALHCTASNFEATDWSTILRHYDELERLRPTPIVRLNKAVAAAHVHGPQAGLEVIAAIEDSRPLEAHYLYHAVKGDFLRRLDNRKGAAESYEKALSLVQVESERAFLESALRAVEADAGSPGERGLGV